MVILEMCTALKHYHPRRFISYTRVRISSPTRRKRFCMLNRAQNRHRPRNLKPVNVNVTHLSRASQSFSH